MNLIGKLAIGLGFVAMVLVTALAQAEPQPLNVDLSVLQPDKTSWSTVRVVAYDGRGRVISSLPVKDATDQTAVTIYLTPSADRPQSNSFYRVWVDGVRLTPDFRMPDATVALSTLFRAERLPPLFWAYAATAPLNPRTGEGWVDTSGSNPLFKVWTGTSWVDVGSGITASQQLAIRNSFAEVDFDADSRELILTDHLGDDERQVIPYQKYEAGSNITFTPKADGFTFIIDGQAGGGNGGSTGPRGPPGPQGIQGPAVRLVRMGRTGRMERRERRG